MQYLEARYFQVTRAFTLQITSNNFRVKLDVLF